MTFFGESRCVHLALNLKNEESQAVVDEVQAQGINIKKGSKRSQILQAKDDALTDLKKHLEKGGHDSIDINDSIKANDFRELISSLQVQPEDIQKLVKAVESAEKRGKDFDKNLERIMKTGLLSDEQYDEYKARAQDLKDTKTLDTADAWQLEQDILKTAQRLPEHAAVKSKFDTFGTDENVLTHFEQSGETFKKADGTEVTFAELAADDGKKFGNLTFADKKALLSQVEDALKKANYDPKAAEKAAKLLNDPKVPESHKEWLEDDSTEETLSYKVNWLEQTGMPELESQEQERNAVLEKHMHDQDTFFAFAKGKGVDLAGTEREFLGKSREERESELAQLRQIEKEYDTAQKESADLAASGDLSGAEKILEQQGQLGLMEAEAEALATEWLQMNLKELQIEDRDINAAVDQKKNDQQEFEDMGMQASEAANLRQQAAEGGGGMWGQLKAFVGGGVTIPEAANDNTPPAANDNAPPPTAGAEKAEADQQAKNEMGTEDKLAAEYIRERCQGDVNVHRELLEKTGLKDAGPEVQKEPAQMERLYRLAAVRNDREKMGKMLKDVETRRLMFGKGNLLEGAKQKTIEKWKASGKMNAANDNIG